jgi:hypothetical protein
VQKGTGTLALVRGEGPEISGRVGRRVTPRGVTVRGALGERQGLLDRQGSRSIFQQGLRCDSPRSLAGERMKKTE